MRRGRRDGPRAAKMMRVWASRTHKAVKKAATVNNTVYLVRTLHLQYGFITVGMLLQYDKYNRASSSSTGYTYSTASRKLAMAHVLIIWAPKATYFEYDE